MEAGQVYEFFVDCTRSDLVTFDDIADEIASKMNEVLGINTRRIDVNVPSSSTRIAGVIIPDYDLKIPDEYRFAFAIASFPYSSSDEKQDISSVEGPIVIRYMQNGDTWTGMGRGVGNATYYEGYTRYDHGNVGYYKTGQIIFRLDTRMWTPENKTYQVEVIHTNRHQGMEEIPSNLKFARPFFVTEITKKQDGSKHMAVVSGGASNVGCTLDEGRTITVDAGTATVNKNSITLRKVFTGEYEHDYFYWVHNGENLTLGNYAIFDNLPYIDEGYRTIKGYDSEYKLFLTNSSGGTNSPSIVMKP